MAAMPIDVGNGAILMFNGPVQLGGPNPPPDDIEAAIVGFIDGARESLDVAVQELEDEAITVALCRAAANGVRVRVVTNSLASTDVMIVHAGYGKYRRDMLRAGIELYELNKKITRQEKKEKKEGSSGSGPKPPKTSSASFTKCTRPNFRISQKRSSWPLAS